MITYTSKLFTVSTVLLHKYEWENVSVTNFMSHFSMFVPTKISVKLANGNMVHAQGIVIIVCRFTKCSIIIHLDQFIIVHFTLTTPSHKVPSNFMLDFKRLCLDLFNIVTLVTFKVVFGYYPTRINTIFSMFKYILSWSTLKETEILFYQLSVRY